MPTFATKTLDDLYAEVRLLVNDAGVGGSSYRYTDQQLISKVNTALRELYRYRPDAYIGNFTTGLLTNNAVTTFLVTDLGLATPLPVDDRLFYNPLLFFVCGMLELGDDEFTDQGRTAQLLASFRQMLVGDGG